jgi:hypothetical protein
MVAVFVGTLITITTSTMLHPSVLVILLLVIIFMLSGICHPKEIWCLAHGLLYMAVIPSGYLLLVIYSIVNLNDVSWGTREVPTKAQREENERKKKEKEEAKKKKKSKSLVSKIFGQGEGNIRELTTLVRTLIPQRDQRPGIDPELAGLMPDMQSMSNTDLIRLLKKIERNTRYPGERRPSTSDDDEHPKHKKVVHQQPQQVEPVKAAVPEVVVSSPVSQTPAPQAPAPKKKEDPNEWRKATWAYSKGIGHGEVVKVCHLLISLCYFSYSYFE